jgi:uncharacterized protein
MHFSKNNIVVELDKKDEWNYVLFNSLIGNVDFLNREYYDYIRYLQKPGDKKELDPAKNEALFKRGYLFENEKQEEEKTKQFISFYLKTINEKRQNIYMIIPGNSCRVGCSYCRYRRLLDGSCLDRDQLGKIMDFIVNNDKETGAKQAPVLVFYGGESLPDNEPGFNLIKKVLEDYSENFARIGFHTFGFNLERYSDLLLRADAEKLFFTFILKENEDLTRDDVILSTAVESSLDLLRMQGMQAFLSIKITRQSVNKIPGYINDLIAKGLVLSPNCKLQVKPTFEKSCTLFNPCSVNYDLYETIFKIYAEYPQLEFADFCGWGVLEILQYLLKMRERFPPRTDFCSANRDLVIFDPVGNIFTCYHAVRDQKLAVGNINHTRAVDETKLNPWRGRSVERIEECSGCPARYLCSGGCAFEALTKKGSILKPDCQPYEELLKWAFESLHEDFLDSERYAPV